MSIVKNLRLAFFSYNRSMEKIKEKPNALLEVYFMVGVLLGIVIMDYLFKNLENEDQDGDE